MQAPLVDLSNTLECPQCSKHAVVSHQTGVYRCLNCDFERDLGSQTPQEAEGGIGELVFACAGFLIACALLL
ncbi:MAG: hypothetical protein F6K42_38775 [Leptolyngbya sp. SIO1D8]|nr:hypothetical protein [Leptolyngbya sp. SIO1D8]